MGAIPTWLQIILKLVIQIGSPYLLDYLKKLMKNLPADIVAIIDSLIKGLKDSNTPNAEARRSAKSALKKYCDGVGCPVEPKK